MTILRPMTTAEFKQYMLHSIPEYANDKIKSGQWNTAEAIEQSRHELHKALPKGINTSNNFLFTLVSKQDKESVGILWYAIQPQAGNNTAYVYDISIKPQYQRKGHATRAFEALETMLKKTGIAGIGLNVFGFNKNAYELYIKLGFQPSSIQMFKPL